MRLSVPLGLNVCPPFHSITKSERPQSIIPPARSVIEDETRRNAFWLAYAIEREHGFGNAWAHALDDADISQLLPVRGDLFQQGVGHISSYAPRVPLNMYEHRPWSRHSNDSGHMSKTSSSITQMMRRTPSSCTSRGQFYCVSPFYHPSSAG